LLELIQQLVPQFGHRILIVDDGSTAGQELFSRIKTTGIQVIHHEINQGKGAAIKTGLHWITENFQDIKGIVTVDADGQHLFQDIVKVAELLRERPDALVLGTRLFDAQDIPWRNRFGNRLTGTLCRLLTGMDITDTQTGLRGIPADFVPTLLTSRYNGYEFETHMLLLAQRYKLKLHEVTISSVYSNNNESSHFHPMLDSIRIYLVMFRSIFSLLLAAVIDYLAFVLLLVATGNLIASQYMSRTLSGSCLFLIHHRQGLLPSRPGPWSLAAYLVLAHGFGTLSLLLIVELASSDLSVHAAKPIVEMLVLVASLSMQRLVSSIQARRTGRS